MTTTYMYVGTHYNIYEENFVRLVRLASRSDLWPWTPLRGRRERPELKFRFFAPDVPTVLSVRAACIIMSPYSRGRARRFSIMSACWLATLRATRACVYRRRHRNFGGSVEPNRPPHDNRNIVCVCVLIFVGFFPTCALFMCTWMRLSLLRIIFPFSRWLTHPSSSLAVVMNYYFFISLSFSVFLSSARGHLKVENNIQSYYDRRLVRFFVTAVASIPLYNHFRSLSSDRLPLRSVMVVPHTPRLTRCLCRHLLCVLL